MKICLLTLYLNHFYENKFMFGWTLKKLFYFFYFFCGIAKLICELRHTFFTNLRFRQILILRPSALFKNICVLRQSNLLILPSAATPAPPSFNFLFELPNTMSLTGSYSLPSFGFVTVEKIALIKKVYSEIN